MKITQRKGKVMDDTKEEEGGKCKLWFEKEEEDKMFVFYQKDTRIKRQF